MIILYNIMSNNSFANNPNELIQEIEDAAKNSPLEGISDIYNEYYNLISFIFEIGDSITYDTFVGDSGFIGYNIEYDGQELFTEIKKKDNISAGEFCFFSVDLLDFIIHNLDEVCKSNTEVIDILSNFSYRFSYGSYDETYNALVNNYRELRSLKENSNNNLFAVSESDILLLQFFTTMRNFFKVIGSHITWDEEPEVGNYITYNVERNNSDSTITCKITNKYYNDDFDVNTYDYEIIGYDSIVLEKYPKYWLFEYENNKDKLIEPIHSSYLTVHENNPLKE